MLFQYFLIWSDQKIKLICLAIDEKNKLIVAKIYRELIFFYQLALLILNED